MTVPPRAFATPGELAALGRQLDAVTVDLAAVTERLEARALRAEQAILRLEDRLEVLESRELDRLAVDAVARLDARLDDLHERLGAERVERPDALEYLRDRLGELTSRLEHLEAREADGERRHRELEADVHALERAAR